MFPFLAVLSCLSYYILSVLSCLSNPVCPFLNVLYCLCPFMSVLSCLTFPACSLLSVLSYLSLDVCPFLSVLFWHSTSDCRLLVSSSVFLSLSIVSCISSPVFPPPGVASCRVFLVCPRLSYLSSRVFTLLSLLFCFLFLSVLSCLSTSVSRRLSFLDYQSSTVRPLLGPSRVCHLTMSSSVLSIFLSCLSFLSVLFSAFHIVCPSWLSFSVLSIFLSCLSFLSDLSFQSSHICTLAWGGNRKSSIFPKLSCSHWYREETESRKFSLNFRARTDMGRKQKVVNFL